MMPSRVERSEVVSGVNGVADQSLFAGPGLSIRVLSIFRFSASSRALMGVMTIFN